ncbi:MAG: hypothetical protein AAFR82_09450 [Pseudomonadota bacterium]
MGGVGYFLGLIVVLIALWTGLSGDYTLTKPLIASLGAVSIILSAILAYRFEDFDQKPGPIGNQLNDTRIRRSFTV